MLPHWCLEELGELLSARHLHDDVDELCCLFALDPADLSMANALTGGALLCQPRCRLSHMGVARAHVHHADVQEAVLSDVLINVSADLVQSTPRTVHTWDKDDVVTCQDRHRHRQQCAATGLCCTQHKQLPCVYVREASRGGGPGVLRIMEAGGPVGRVHISNPWERTAGEDTG